MDAPAVYQPQTDFLGALAPSRELGELHKPPKIDGVDSVSPPAPGFEPRYQFPQNQTSYAQFARAYEALFGRISSRLGPTNPRWNTFQGELKPETILQAIQTANAGIPFVICDMYRRAYEQDAHLSGTVYHTFAQILGCADRIQAPDALQDDLLANNVAIWLRAVREQVENFDEARFGLLWAEGQGFSGAENIYDFRHVIWKTSEGKRIARDYLIPVRMEIVEGRAFRFNTETDEPLLWIEGDYLTLPPGKFVFHTAHGVTQIRERRGFMRACLFLHAIKSWTIRDCAEYLHIYGLEQMVLEYHPKFFEYPEAKELADRLRVSMGQGGIPAVPIETTNLRNVSPGPKGAMVHTEAGDWLNTEMTKSITASGPLTMKDGGGNYGLGDVHAHGAYHPQALRARNLCRSIRYGTFLPALQLNKFRLAQDLADLPRVDVNPEAIVASLPDYVPQVDRETDMEKRQRVFSAAMEDGVECSTTQYRSTFQLDKPKDKSDILRGKGQPIPSSGAIVPATEASKGAESPMPNGDSGGSADSTDIAFITVDERREKLGLGPWPNREEGKMTVAAFMAKYASQTAQVADAEDGAETQENS